MKQCSCGEQSRDDAVQCLCGRPFPTICHAPPIALPPAITPDFQPTPILDRPNPTLTAVGALFWAGFGTLFLLVGIFTCLIPFIAGPAIAFSIACFVIAGVITSKKHGICPYCGEIGSGMAPGFNCAACQGRILVRGDQFIPAPQVSRLP